MSDIKKKFEEMIERFNQKAERDEKFRKEIEKYERLVKIVVTDEKTYNCLLKNGRIEGLNEGEVEKPQIIITSDTATYMGIMDGTKDGFAEYARGRLKVKASLGDMLLAKKLMG